MAHLSEMRRSEIRRIVCGHDWRYVAEWARALGELAELTDDQIDSLGRRRFRRRSPEGRPHAALSLRSKGATPIGNSIRRRFKV
jgi:hypothetical protein